MWTMSFLVLRCVLYVSLVMGKFCFIKYLITGSDKKRIRREGNTWLFDWLIDWSIDRSFVCSIDWLIELSWWVLLYSTTSLFFLLTNFCIFFSNVIILTVECHCFLACLHVYFSASCMAVSIVFRYYHIISRFSMLGLFMKYLFVTFFRIFSCFFFLFCFCG